jgi:O-antigen/teichoic acid export membrane protein
LGVAYLIYIVSSDKLIVYAALICGVQLTIRFLYGWYCKRHFTESKIIWHIDWKKIKSIFSFTGWAMFGALASLGFTQGLNVLLGMFFSPVVNAARGIAVTVQGFINTLVTNFQTAINPQIIKSYANQNQAYLEKLIYSSAKLSFYLLFIITLPIYLEADIILNIWLKEVPEYSVVFFRLIIITTMIDAISNSIMTSVEATGNIRKYQVVVGGILLMIVPIAYVVLRLGYPPASVFVVHIIVAIIAFCFRLLLGSKVVGFSKRVYLRKVILPIASVTIAASIIPILLWLWMPGSFVRLIIVGGASVLCVLGTIWFFGVDESEKKLVTDKINDIKGKFIKHD